ncbi:FAD:protein FMN transferase [Staphylococcus americanisciuri]|uniref:FAD:protein FMN transferase n=1 Tax=Staphylococcus americanisciuri TaxID=2973940 RepID=A0ABT2EZG0_9STAP|nr:FAD:protein FMN transferase [Staphylococcus americanisciuri]MCS4485596.1 FAD:protein FMN transferase [Staphylococcus americanisciuri]
MQTEWIQAMGTTIRLSIEHASAKLLLAEAKHRIEDWEQRFSANRQDSALMKINQQAGQRPVKIDEELFHLIELGYQATISSQLKLNILIGPLVKLWRIGFQDVREPSPSEIATTLTRINPLDMKLNSQNHTVYLQRPGMEIDLGAIAKGYFADELKSYFVEQGVKRGIIDFGGNVVTIGTPGNTSHYWQVGIQNPFMARGIAIETIQVAHQAVVTSGIYERCFTSGEKLYHHILDAKTGYPVENDIASVSIVSDYAIDGEIWTTICCFGYAAQNIALLDQIDGIEGLIVRKDGKVLTTQKLHRRI